MEQHIGTGSSLRILPALDASDAPSERVDGYAWKSLAATVLGNAMDGFDMLLLAFMLPALSAAFSLTSAEAGTIVTATLVGAVAGGLGFGLLSDRFGRVKVMTWSIVVFALFTGACGLASGYTELLVYRGLAGLGLGGEWGIGMALIAEAWPPSKRARATSYVGMGWSVGVLLATFASAALLPVVGWRGLFFVGVIPAIPAFVIRYSLGEPAVFVEKSKLRSERSSLAAMFKDRQTTRASIGIAVLCAVQNFGYFGLLIWMPSYLSRTFGYQLTKSAMWTGVTVLGMMLGTWVFGHLADRFGRRPIFILYQVGAAVMVFVYSQLTEPTHLLIGGALMGLFVNGMVGGYGALMAEVYPTYARGTASNAHWNVGRAIGGFGPVVIGTLAANFSFATAIAFLALIYVVDVLATVFLIPELNGQALE
jgi:benzoate transport